MNPMRAMYNAVYRDGEKRGCIKLAYQTIFMAMQTVIRAMELLSIQYGNPSNAVCISFTLPHIIQLTCTYLLQSQICFILKNRRSSTKSVLHIIKL